MKTKHLAWLLILQLALGVFFPPIAIGIRKLFISDLIFMLIAAVGTAVLFTLKTRTKETKLALFGIVIFFSVVYLHGYFRPSIRDQLNAVGFYIGNEQPELFDPGRELVVFFRFLSWVVSFVILQSIWGRSDKPAAAKAQSYFLTALSAILVVESILILFAQVSVWFRTVLGAIYSYNPDYEYWRGRAYGTFGSPVEAGMALAFGVLILFLFSTNLKNKNSRIFCYLSALVSVVALFCTHTATAWAALFCAFGVIGVREFFRRRSKKTKYLRWVVPSVLLLFVFLGAFYVHTHPIFLERKINDITGRFWTWKIFMQALISHPSSLVLGFGFVRYPSDSSFFAIVLRFGFAGLLAIFFAVRKILQKLGLESRVLFVSVLVFFLVSGLTLDVVLYRHMVLFLICSALPIFITSSIVNGRE